MDKKIKGSWLIHHTNKLQNVNNQNDYENIFMAGKAGILLSAMSSNNEITISKERVRTLAKASNISTNFELPKLINILEARQLIDVTEESIAILGVTTSATLSHTSDIFESLSPKEKEIASITLSEKSSILPIKNTEISEEISDIYHLSSNEVNQILYESEQIGFVDVEEISKKEKLLFNGNLFRRESTQKINAVLDSLSSIEQIKLSNFSEYLKKNACIPVQKAKNELGEKLFSKLISIGLFDLSVVSNSIEEVGYLTLPSAFSKYSSSMVDDAFDLAKAFVSSITYGMTKSSYQRGQITMVEKLLEVLIKGDRVGPVRAIGEDYKILELKGVVEVKNGSKKCRDGPMLRLIKKEVGELALLAIQNGDISEHSLPTFPSAAVTNFKGPEYNRSRERRKQIQTSPQATNDMLSSLRQGDILS